MKSLMWTSVVKLSTLILLSSPLTCGSDENEPVVHTPLGRLRGYTMTSRAGRRFYAFSGVPYARPPVGHLRFERPMPAVPWSGVRNAKEDGPYCLQLNIYQLNPSPKGVEDCLYLSVYTHNMSGKAPVMVHYHGGGYVSGTGARRTKPNFLMDEDVVIVDVNYRVGILGFLSFEDDAMPGNQGMKDQVMSLHWVKQNIASFGGDPDCVTIVGESAGARSVYHHTVSPLSRGLFHRAISESGSSYNLGSIMPKGYVRKNSYKLAELTNCMRNSTRQIVDCLKTLNGSEIVAQLVKYRQWQIDPVMTFRVVFEKGPDAFMKGPIRSWKHAPVPYLAGVTSGEGLLRTMYFIYYNMSWEYYTENFNNVTPTSLGYFNTASNPDQVTNEVRQFYLPKRKITLEDDWSKVVQMYGDSWIFGGLIGAEKHTSDVYFYYLDYLGEYNAGGARNQSLIVGTPHTDEILYIWNMSSVNYELKGKDLEHSKKLVKLWTNFAKHGNPTPGNSELKWETYKPGHRYLHIGNDGYRMEERLAQDRYTFWKQLNYSDILDS